MGFDSVELVMTVQDEFRIGISDGAAAEMTKVSHLVDYVYAAISGTLDEAKLWSQLDEKFSTVTGIGISDLPPDTKVLGLLQKGQEVAQWRTLQLKPGPSRPRS